MKIGTGASSNCVLDTIINLHWNHHTLFLSLPVHMSKKHKSTPSVQEMKEQALLCRKKEELHAHFEHLLKQLVDSPDKYKRGEFRYIREFVTFIEGHRDDFPHVMGDKLYDTKVPADNNWTNPTPSIGYIQALAQRRENTSDAFPTPIVQVVHRETKFRPQGFVDSLFKNGRETNTQAPMQFTHLSLRDGDNNTMLGRMACHNTQEARKLKPGDIIKLTLFTELTYRIGDSAPMPGVVIINYSRVGYASLPVDINNPLVCAGSDLDRTSLSTAKEHTVENESIIQKDITNPECTFKNRLCSKHGVSLICCICESNPVAELDLQTVKEDCYFATHEVADMTNSQKRCMIYWWYATNIYSICGKGRRLQLPDCLVHAVRKEYPEPDGVYTGFSF